MGVTVQRGLKIVPIRHASGRKVEAGELKAGKSYTIDMRTGRVQPPIKPKPKKQ